MKATQILCNIPALPFFIGKFLKMGGKVDYVMFYDQDGRLYMTVGFKDDANEPLGDENENPAKEIIQSIHEKIGGGVLYVDEYGRLVLTYMRPPQPQEKEVAENV